MFEPIIGQASSFTCTVKKYLPVSAGVGDQQKVPDGLLPAVVVNVAPGIPPFHSNVTVFIASGSTELIVKQLVLQARISKV